MSAAIWAGARAVPDDIPVAMPVGLSLEPIYAYVWQDIQSDTNGNVTGWKNRGTGGAQGDLTTVSSAGTLVREIVGGTRLGVKSLSVNSFMQSAALAIPSYPLTQIWVVYKVGSQPADTYGKVVDFKGTADSEFARDYTKAHVMEVGVFSGYKQVKQISNINIGTPLVLTNAASVLDSGDLVDWTMVSRFDNAGRRAGQQFGSDGILNGGFPDQAAYPISVVSAQSRYYGLFDPFQTRSLIGTLFAVFIFNANGGQSSGDIQIMQNYLNDQWGSF